MSVFYVSERIGKEGKPFRLWKFKTLKDGTDKKSSFANTDQYLPLGRFLRKTKLDELPQILSVLNGSMALVGPRPMEPKEAEILPEDIKKIILSVRPGLSSPASIHFSDEEKLLQMTSNPIRAYWMEVKPAKILLDFWYVQNRCLLLDIVVIWMTIKKICRQVFIQEKN